MGTHVSDESWFSRIGGAIKGILVGGILCIIAPVLLFWNEGRAVKTAKGLKEGAKIVETIQVDSVDPSREGKFVHLTADATTDEQLRDDEFGVEVNGVRLVRHVETYQWKEKEHTKTKKKLGGGKRRTTTYSYEKVWSSNLIESTGFDEADTHRNPSNMPFSPRSLQAKLVHVGAFKLPDSLISQISGSDPIQIEPSQLPANIVNRVQFGQHNGSTLLYVPYNQSRTADQANQATPNDENKLGLIDLSTVGTDQAPKPDDGETQPIGDATDSNSETNEATEQISGDPQIGDTRIWFTATPVSTVSLMSAQAGDSFKPFITQTETQLHRLEMGSVTADEMIKHAEHENTVLTWVLRGVGTFVCFLGFVFLMRPLVVLADVIPMFGSLLGIGSAIIGGLLAIAVSFTTIGIAWIFYRPVLGVSLLAISAVCLFLIFRRSRAAAAAKRAGDVDTLTEMDLV